MKPKRLPKIQTERYSNRTGQFRHDHGDIVFEKRFEVKKVKREGKCKKYNGVGLWRN